MADNQYMHSADDDNLSVDTPEYINILNILDTEIGPFPRHLINLLKFLGYDNYLSLKDFNEKDISELEVFAQNDLQQLLDTNQLEKYYGVYAKFTKRFRVLPGHRKLLLSIKDYLLDKGRKYFLRKIHAATAIHPSARTSSPFIVDNPSNYPRNLHASNQRYADDDIDLYDAQDSNDEGPPDVKRTRLLPIPSDSSKSLPFNQVIHFKPEDHEQHIRSLVNRWFQASISKLARGVFVADPEDFSIIFHHKPEENKVTASIQCCICRNNIGVSSQLRKSGSFRWLISNYMRHVKRLHFAKEFQLPPIPHGSQQTVYMIDDDMPHIKTEFDENEIRQMV